MKNTIFVTAICVGLVAMMSARAAEKAESPSLAILSDNKAGASFTITMANRSSSFWKRTELGKENHDQNATGDKYYFTDGKLIAATAADGKSIDVKSAEGKR